MLYLGVVLKRVDAEVLAIARLLEAAVRHLRRERDMVVDPHAAKPQRVRDAHGPGDVTRPYRAGEPIRGAVGPRDRLLLVREWLDGDHGTEDLPLDHLVALPQPGDDGRL